MVRFLTRAVVPVSLVLATRSNAAAAEPPSTSPPNVVESVPTPSADSSAPETTATTEPASSPVVETALPDKPTQLPDTSTSSIPQKGLPRLRINADMAGVRLMRIERAMSDDMGEGLLVRTVCVAPCDQVIDARKRQTFFFGAEGMVPSRGFKLSRLDGDIVAHVHGGSYVARQVGFLLGAFGGAAVLGGATMLGVGYAQRGTHLSSEGKIVEGPNPNLTTGGLIVLGAGAAVVTTAIVLVATAKTRIVLVHADDKSALVSFEKGAFRF
jgi:hypothetical protein